MIFLFQKRSKKQLAQKKRYGSDILLYLFLLAQLGVWNITRHYPPNMAIVPDVPSEMSVKAFSLGDGQFYFRLLAYQLQNAGDSFGRFTPLKDYNYHQLYYWFVLLDSLDHRSNFVPSIASYYFSQTQRTEDVRYVVDYLDQHASKDLYHKWWWMAQAVYLANHKLKDKDLALKLANKLAKTPRDDIPLWTKQMPAFIHEQRGELDEALVIIEDIAKNADHMDEGELNFMRYFVQERLGKVIEQYPEHLQKKQPQTPSIN
jgi:hypothetical protein